MNRIVRDMVFGISLGTLGLLTLNAWGQEVDAQKTPEKQAEVPHPASEEVQTSTQPLRLFFGGDVMVGRYVNGKLRLHGGDNPFQVIADIVPKDELMLINLETPISDDMAPIIKRSKNPSKLKVVFRMPEELTPVLAESGVDVAVLANNHAEDCGAKKIRNTVEILEKNGIYPVGAHHEKNPFTPLVLEQGEHKIVIVAATLLRNFGGSRMRPDDPLAFVDYRKVKQFLKEKVSEVRAAYPEHFLVLSMHWGKEAAFDVPASRRRIARLAIDSGANVFWGHHTHTLQPTEIYRGGLIMYSMGNLIFDMVSAIYRRSGILELSASRGEDGSYSIKSFDMHGVTLGGYRGPARRSTPKEIKATMKRLRKDFRSDDASSPPTLEGERLHWERGPNP